MYFTLYNHESAKRKPMTWPDQKKNKTHNKSPINHPNPKKYPAFNNPIYPMNQMKDQYWVPD